MVMELRQLPPVQQRMVLVLRDGLPHKRDELQACLQDELAHPKAVIVQLCKLRKVLRTQGLDVVCRAFGGRSYHRFQLVRLVNQDG
jgi:hypothetical protein